MATIRQQTDTLIPPFAAGTPAAQLCLRAVGEFMKCDPGGEEAVSNVEQVRTKLLTQAGDCGPDSQSLRFIISVLADLRSQGWGYELQKEAVRIIRPDAKDKAKVRASHAIGRDKQLRQPAVRTFIRKMERRQLRPGGWLSIFDLMRDGRDLAAKLREAHARPTEEESLAALRQAIDPYIQVVRPGAVCEITGYELGEIWRYFRHTWATSYKSAVGRELKVIVRDRATKNHAVIGIGAMVSPRHLVHVDRWVGWEKREFLAALEKETSKEWAEWLDASLTELISDIYNGDFVADKILKRSHLAKPSQEVIDRLLKEADSARSAHRLYPEQAEHKGEGEDKQPVDWVARAKTHLYRGNRASALAELLRARLSLSNAGFKSPTARCLAAALKTGQGRDAVGTVLKYVKAAHAGINVLDISVCGAVPPYSPILGGKLVAMLLASSQIVQAYNAAYRASPSIIASAMAGRPLIREPHLVLLTTSSLYGDPLNQYTRVAIPANEVGGDTADAVRYVELGHTLGQGSHHIGDETVEEAEVLLTQRADGHRVNSIFGEGVNPRLRKIRNALDICGFNSDYVLEHGSSRVLYGVALASNFRDILRGRAEQPAYILPQQDPEGVTSRIADYWRRRWLIRRIAKDQALEQVATHTPVRPIQHGAKVVLPPVEEEDGPLFSGLGE